MCVEGRGAGLIKIRLIRWARALVPLSWRRARALQKRARADALLGLDFVGPGCQTGRDTLQASAVEITQPILPAPFVDEKRHNLAKGCCLLQDTEILPGQTFSFWHLIGPPTARNGWKAGRTIINDVMTTDPGGGLCQLASLIFHLGLRLGLTIIERHAHSRDIHETDQSRFTPLGLDATIVFGFKDLRLHNPTGLPIVLQFELTEHSLTGRALAPDGLPLPSVELIRTDGPGQRQASLSRIWSKGQPDEHIEHVATTIYRI
jgi:vancomycin resistance protein VanW